MSRLSDALDRLGSFAEVVADVATLRQEMDLIAGDAPYATLVRAWLASASMHNQYRPLSLMPIMRSAPVSHAVAVGWHTPSPSVAQSDPDICNDRRLLAGQLVHRAKLYDTTMWTTDAEDIQRIGVLATWALATTNLRYVPEVIKGRFPVVSGGARGTDFATHEEAVRLDGMTIVVLAEGIMSSRARLLAQHFEDAQIAIVSPFLPDQTWQSWSAMQRNRTILGLSDRLVVIEAGERGGTIAAGRDALSHEVATWVLDYAEPPAAAQGNRLLIEEGAQPIPVSDAGEVTVPPELFAIHDWVVNVIE